MTVRAAALRALGLAVAAGSFGGCGDSYSAVFDSLPDRPRPAPRWAAAMAGDGALVAIAAQPEAPGAIVPDADRHRHVDDAAPGPAPDRDARRPRRRASICSTRSARTDPAAGRAGRCSATSACCVLPLQAIGDGSVAPGGILGGDILRRYSVDLRFGAACETNATGHLLHDDVLGAPRRGSRLPGGRGLRGAPLRALRRRRDRRPRAIRTSSVSAGRWCCRRRASCSEAAPCRPILPRPSAGDQCCKEADALQRATGVDLALMLDTGVGPLVLGQSAWDARQGKAGGRTRRGRRTASLLVASWPVPIAATWSTLPRFALVDNETGAATDPGPCVELGARAAHRAGVVPHRHGPDGGRLHAPVRQRSARARQVPEQRRLPASCPEQIPVAVIADEEPYLQGLRFDVRPEGPELDGVLGAGALGRSRVEIDYTSAPTRAVFSCEPDAPRDRVPRRRPLPAPPRSELRAPLLRTTEARARPDLHAVGMLTRTRTRT